MIKKLVLFLLPAALLASCSVTDETSSSNNEVIFADYQELPDPDPADEAAWDDLDKPFYARFGSTDIRSEEHTSELQSLMRTSYDVFVLKTKKPHNSNWR